jgi:carboxymethylenebutenolidase
MTVGIQQLMRQIEQVRDAFHTAVYTDHDLDAALDTTTADCVLVNLPMATGASGQVGLGRYLADDVLPQLPADLSFQRISRTVDQRRLVEEATVGFTHDRELSWLLPGVPPTGRRAEVLAVSVVAFRHASRLGVTESRIQAHRTLWDLSGLLAQLRVDPSEVAALRSASG